MYDGRFESLSHFFRHFLRKLVTSGLGACVASIEAGSVPGVAGINSPFSTRSGSNVLRSVDWTVVANKQQTKMIIVCRSDRSLGSSIASIPHYFRSPTLTCVRLLHWNLEIKVVTGGSCISFLKAIAIQYAGFAYHHHHPFSSHPHRGNSHRPNLCVRSNRKQDRLWYCWINTTNM